MTHMDYQSLLPNALCTYSKDTGATSEEKSSLVNIKPGQQNKIPGNASGSGTPNTSAAAGGNAASASAQAKGSVGTSGINLEAVGEYNGVPITEVDLDGLDDKPWRKPGMYHTCMH